MATLHINFKADDYRRLSGGDVNLAQFLTPLLHSSSTGAAEAFKHILHELFEYYRHDGGSPEIHDFVIDTIEYNPQTLTGQVWLGYTVKYTYTCSGIKNEQHHRDSFRFTIDLDKCILALKFPEPVGRDTFEEF